MHFVQIADGTGHYQADGASHRRPGLCLRKHAPVRRLVLLAHRRDGGQLTQFATSAERKPSWLRVEVRLFAAAADLAGARQLELSVPEGCPLTEFVQCLVQHHPSLQPLARVSRWAVDEQFVPADFTVQRELTIAMIPPVSGG